VPLTLHMLCYCRRNPKQYEHMNGKDVQSFSFMNFHELPFMNGKHSVNISKKVFSRKLFFN
jgi:hypothetical protein